MTQDQTTQIIQTLGRLEAHAIGTNEHLSKLNGKVAEHEGRLNKMDVEDGKLVTIIEAMKSKDSQEGELRAKWLDRGMLFAVTIFLQLGLLVLVRSGIVNLEKKPQTLTEVQAEVIRLQAEAKELELKSKTIDSNETRTQ